MFKRALGKCFHFGFRVVEIMETFETYLETCFRSRSYAWTDLESIWYGSEACVLTFPATQKCENFTGSRIKEMNRK